MITLPTLGIVAAARRTAPSAPTPPAGAPNSIGNKVLWVDAQSHAEYLGLAPGATQVVPQLYDLSGLVHHLAQSTAAARPLLMHDGVRWIYRFDGVDDWVSLTFPLALPLHVVVALRMRVLPSASHYQNVFNGTNWYSISAFGHVGNDVLYFGGGGFIGQQIGSGFDLYEFLGKSVASTMIKNGGSASTGNPSFSDPGGLVVGAAVEYGLSNFAYLDLPGFLVTTSPIGASDLAALRSWMNQRYTMGLGL